MNKIVKRVLFALGGLLLTGIISIMIALWPYLQKPPMPEEEIQKVRAAWRAEAEILAALPKADREALDAFCKKYKTLFDSAADMGSRKDCPPYSKQFLAEVRGKQSELLHATADFDAFAADGFVCQHDFSFDAEFPDFRSLRYFVYWTAGQSLASEDFLSPYRRGLRLAADLQNSRMLLGVMVGLAIETAMNEALIQKLPKLSPDQFDKVSAFISDMPDPTPKIIRSFMTEAAVTTEMYAGTSREIMGEETYQWEQSQLDIRLLRLTGQMKREMRWFVYLMNNQIEQAQKWYETGEFDETANSAMINSTDHSLLATGAVPNVRALLERGIEATKMRESLLAAIAAEPKRRAGGDKLILEYKPGKSWLVIDNENGCVTKESPAELN